MVNSQPIHIVNKYVHTSIYIAIHHVRSTLFRFYANVNFQQSKSQTKAEWSRVGGLAERS